MKYYYCEICGNVLEAVDDKNVTPICCGKQMNELTANNDDSAAKEKHVPVFNKNGYLVNVKVGETPHPMSEEHYIKWIEVETDKGIYRKFLNPDDKPTAEFVINEKEVVLKVYAYCNLHGLWVC